MIASMDIIGDRFSTGEVFIPEMLMAAQAMEAGVSVLKNSLLSTFDRFEGSWYRCNRYGIWRSARYREKPGGDYDARGWIHGGGSRDQCQQ